MNFYGRSRGCFLVTANPLPKCIADAKESPQRNQNFPWRGNITTGERKQSNALAPRIFYGSRLKSIRGYHDSLMCPDVIDALSKRHYLTFLQRAPMVATFGDENQFHLRNFDFSRYVNFMLYAAAADIFSPVKEHDGSARAVASDFSFKALLGCQLVPPGVGIIRHFQKRIAFLLSRLNDTL